MHPSSKLDAVAGVAATFDPQSSMIIPIISFRPSSVAVNDDQSVHRLMQEGVQQTSLMLPRADYDFYNSWGAPVGVEVDHDQSVGSLLQKGVEAVLVQLLQA